jgi:hypothetical protein
MAIEEITLSVPGVGRADAEGTTLPGRRAAARSSTSPECDFVRSYRKLVRERDRFALGRRAHRRRQENFDAAFKSLVKNLAQEVTGGIPSRSAKLAARTRIYISIVGLAHAVASEHRRSRASARRLLRWATGIGAFGILGLAYTVLSNGWLP